nr:hypothetical protein StreXyl84_24130 [Streptomyces sp. Xyl84]
MRTDTTGTAEQDAITTGDRDGGRDPGSSTSDAPDPGPGDIAPGDSAPASTDPEGSTPRSTGPGDGAPASTGPGDSAPGAADPGDATPGGSGRSGRRAPFRGPRLRGRHRRPRPRRVLLTAGALAVTAGVLSLVRLTSEYGHGGPGTAEAEPYRHPGQGGVTAAPSSGAALTATGTARAGKGPSVLPSSALPMGGIGAAAAPGTAPAPPASAYGTGPVPSTGPAQAAGPAAAGTASQRPETTPPPGAPAHPPAPAGTSHAPAPHPSTPAPAPSTRAPAPPPPPSGGGGAGSGGDGDLCIPVIGVCVGLR